MGVASVTESGSEIWIWSELIDGKGKAASDREGNKHILSPGLSASIVSLHPLSSGEVLARGSDGRSAILQRETSIDAALEDQNFVTRQLSSTKNGESCAQRPCTVVHSYTVMDPVSASHMLYEGCAQRVGEEILALQVTVESPGRSLSHRADADSNTVNAITAGNERRSRRRKTVTKVIDDADTSPSRNGLLPLEEVFVEASFILSAGSDRGQENHRRITSASRVKLIGIADASTLLDVHLHHDGLLTLLTRSGDLHFRTLRLDAARQIVIASPSRNISLRHISHSSLPSRPAAVLRLSPSYLLVVLYATGGPSSGKLAALILDTDLNALIVASDYAMLSASGVLEEDQQVTVSLARVGGSQAIVNVNYWGKSQGQEAALSAFWTLPFYVPDGSVLRNAIGKGALNSLWLRAEDVSIPLKCDMKKAGGQACTSDFSGSQRQLLEKLKGLLSQATSSQEAGKQSIDMDTLFTSWLSAETERLRSEWEKARSKQEKDEADALRGDEKGESESDTDEDGADHRQKAQREADAPLGSAKRDGPPKPHLSYSFVVALLACALPPVLSARTDSVYSRKIVSYLVERQSVSCGMLSGSEQELIERLHARGDWALLMACLKKVHDVGEMDLVNLLCEVIRSEEQPKSVVQVAEHQVPSLASFLSLFVTLPVSRPLLRSMLHGRVTRVQDVVAILEILKDWLQERALEPLELASVLLKDDVSGGAKRKSRRQRMRLGKRDAIVKVPPLSDVVNFATDIIDVYFPLLLSTPSSQGTLRMLFKTLSWHLSACDQMSVLRGPLDAFAKVDADRKQAEALEATGPGAARWLSQGYRDGRVGRAASSTAMDLLPSKSQTGGGATQCGDKRSARLHAFESSALVGPYSVEVLEV